MPLAVPRVSARGAAMILNCYPALMDEEHRVLIALVSARWIEMFRQVDPPPAADRDRHPGGGEHCRRLDADASSAGHSTVRGAQQRLAANTNLSTRSLLEGQKRPGKME